MNKVLKIEEITSQATTSCMPGAAITVLTKMEKVPSVELIMTGNEGEVIATFHFGVNPEAANWLSRASRMDDPKNPVKKNDTALLVLGQDSYAITRECALLLRLLAYPTKSWSEISQLEKNMPETAKYTVIVSF